MRAWRRHAEQDIAVAIVAGALLFATPRVSRRHIFGDSIAYMKWPDEFIYDGVRIMGARPPVYPLMLDLLGTGSVLVYAQALLSFIAWSWLGWLVGRLPGAVVGTGFALLPVIWRWNVCILTESASLSMMALCLALSLRLARRAAAGERLSWPSLAGFALTVCMFAWLRDANLLVLPAFLLPACYGALRQRSACALIVAVAIGVGWADSRAHQRTQFSLDNAVIGRVLVDDEATRRFAAAGMPLSPRLLEGAGKPGLSNQRALRTSSPEFFAWSARHAAPLYWRWVLARPPSYVQAWRASESYYTADLAMYPAKLRLPILVRATGSFAPLGRGWWTLVLVVMVLGATAVTRGLSPDAALAGFAYGTALVTQFVTYHADTVEVHRHMLVGLVLQRAAFFMAAAVLMRALWQHFERQRHAAAAVAES